MNQHIHIHGIKLASGEDLSFFDKNQIINLFQCKTNDKIPSNILNALDLLECRVRKGEFSVTSDFVSIHQDGVDGISSAGMG